MRWVRRLFTRGSFNFTVDADILAQSAFTLPPSGSKKVNVYLPELQLMSESEFMTVTPIPAWDYVWFAGQPLAQIHVATGAIRWSFNDHLGTPLLQTNAIGAVVWRLELEPYGEEFTQRAGSTEYQPLRFPGQEDGFSEEVSYNVFRWYRSQWGRYSQADPLLSVMLRDRTSHSEFKYAAMLADPYRYAGGTPIGLIDPLGLAPCGPNPTASNLPCGAKCLASREWALCTFRSYSKVIDSLDLIGAAIGVAGGLVSRNPVVGACGALGFYAIGRLIGSRLPDWFENRVHQQYRECITQCELFACLNDGRDDSPCRS